MENPSETPSSTTSSPRTIVYEGRFPSLNEVLQLAKTHWSVYSKEKERLTTAVAWEAKAAKLRPCTSPVRVTFTWMEANRRRDVDNISHGCKYVLDGLVEASVLEDDSPKYVSEIRHNFMVDKDRPRVIIDIEEIAKEEEDAGDV